MISNNLDAFYHIQIPAPIILCKEFSRCETLVFGVLWSRFLMNDKRPAYISVSEAARRADVKREVIRKTIDKIIKLGFAEKTELNLLKFKCPDEVFKKFKKQIRKDKSAPCDGPIEESSSNQMGGLSRVRKVTHHRSGGDLSQARQVTRHGPPKRIEIENERKTKERLSSKTSFEGSSDNIRDHLTLDDNVNPDKYVIPDKDETDEEPNEQYLEKLQRQEKLNTLKKPRTRKIRKASGDEFTKTPSKRWEFIRALDGSVSSWNSRSIVGYWACSYLEKFGKEDPNLAFPHIKTLECSRLLKNIKRFTELYLDGNYAFAKKAVDDILETAESKGMPVVLRYFFTPRTDNTLRKLRMDRSVRRAETNTQRDDREGSDIEMFQRLAKEDSERRKREREAKRKASH